MKNKKGITLIALVITIIVMLILVGVTINVAINGGLFEKAKEASQDTEKMAIHEQLYTIAQFKNNGKIDVEKTLEEIAKNFNVTPTSVDEGTTSVTLTITGEAGSYKYTVTEDEINIGGNPWYEAGLTANSVQYGAMYNKELFQFCINENGSISLGMYNETLDDMENITKTYNESNVLIEDENILYLKSIGTDNMDVVIVFEDSGLAYTYVGSHNESNTYETLINDGIRIICITPSSTINPWAIRWTGYNFTNVVFDQTYNVQGMDDTWDFVISSNGDVNWIFCPAPSAAVDSGIDEGSFILRANAIYWYDDSDDAGNALIFNSGNTIDFYNELEWDATHPENMISGKTAMLHLSIDS